MLLMTFVLVVRAGFTESGPPPLRLLIVTQAGVPTATVAAREAVAHGGLVDGVRVPVSVEIRYDPRGQTEREFARELRPVLGNVDVVYVTELYIARALQMENGKVPIVFDGVADAVALCLVDSLRSPGRNATGYMHHLEAEAEKLVETLMYGFPATRKIYFLLSGQNVEPTSCDPGDPAWFDVAVSCKPGSHTPRERLRALARVDRIAGKAAQYGVEVEFIVLCEQRDIASLAGVGAKRPDVAFAVPWHMLFVDHAKELVGTLGGTGHPAVYARHSFADIGGVVSIEPTVDPLDDRASIDMLLKVLDGRSPATLPVQTPRGFSIRVNASAAAQQGLRPALSLLRRADKIVQATGRQ
jgi:ABC-type uncharacterized transport system substrate-binding protein